MSKKPFKIRKDFDKFSENKNYPAVVKLASFFNRNKHLDIKTFFEAPYFVYNDVSFYPIDWYVGGLRAVKAYQTYHDKYLVDNPDEDVATRFFKDSIKFIDTFRRQENIDIAEYIDHNTDGIPSFLYHLKERKITMYCLFAFKKFDSAVSKLIKKNASIVELYYPQLFRINYIRGKYLSSSKTKQNITLFKNYVEKKGN